MKKIYKVKEHQEREILSETSYHDYQYMHGNKNGGKAAENPRANPDVLPESAGVWLTDDITRDVQDRVGKLLKIAKQILTQQQYNVFILIAVKDPALTVREASKTLGLSRGRISQLWKAARLKLEKAYEQRTI